MSDAFIHHPKQQGCPDACFKEKAPIVPPWSYVMIHPRRAFLVHNKCGGFGGHEVDVGIPPCAENEAYGEHKDGAFPAVAHIGTPVPKEGNERWKKKCKKGDRSFAHEGQAHEASGKAEVPGYLLLVVPCLVQVVDGSHHERMAIDIPCGCASLKDDVVARHEHECAHKCRGDLAGHAAQQQIEVAAKHHCHQTCRSTLHGKTIAKDGFHACCHPSWQWRFF